MNLESFVEKCKQTSKNLIQIHVEVKGSISLRKLKSEKNEHTRDFYNVADHLP